MNINEITDKFDFNGTFVSCKEFGSGHINQTYIVVYATDNGEQKYILQQINDNVFKNVDSLMNNVFAVTSYLRKMIEKAGGDPDRETLHYIKTKDGKKYYVGDNGSYYRAYIFVKNSVSYDSVDCPEIFKSSGIAFGRFQKMLADFDADTLVETIPHFHDTRWRYENEFLPAIENNKSGRLDTCIKEVEAFKARANDMGKLVDMNLPLRVTHNDTKLNNVMFDADTNECVCVIDLDTVMPGLALYDFGDSIRFGASTASEDEADLDKVEMDIDYFKAYAQGFLSEAGDTLTSSEKDNLAFASKLMTLECGMRFLTDYINGDTYFRVKYPEHNLVRARNQLKLVCDMEDKMNEMEKIIQNI
jgi:cytochrome c556